MCKYHHSIISVIYIAVAVALTWTHPASAMERVLQPPEDFIAEVFPAKPRPRLLWMSKEVLAEASRILGHAPGQLRQRYWSDGKRTLWILEEVGKEDLITAGFVVNEGRIEKTKVLVYRETRGMEIRYPAFLNQFPGVSLVEDNRLDRSIDGISGATLSVQAMVRMTRAALYFDQIAREVENAEYKERRK